MPKPDTLKVLPNPFAYLDHEGLPAGTFAFDPNHSPDRRWVGAQIDREKTKHLPQPGDLTAAIKDASGQVQRVYVDRAPMKRIVFEHLLEEAHHVPASSPHYRLGLREGSLILADPASAEAIGVPFVDPEVALARAAHKAVADWKALYGEEPAIENWPERLRSYLEVPLEPAQVASAAKATSGGVA